MMQTNVMILLMGIAGTGKKTIGEAITTLAPQFRLAHHHAWIDPVLKLLGNDAQVFWSLDEKGWAALNQARDVIFDTMTEVCSKETSFVITYELLANNSWHQEFFNQVQTVVQKRGAVFVPIRLICNGAELVKRLKDSDRKGYFKTQDEALITKRLYEEDVYFSKEPYEMTLDVSLLSAEESARRILDWTSLVYGSKNQNLEFKPLSQKDLNLMTQWFAEPTVKQGYARNQQFSLEDIRAKYLPRIEGMDPVPSFIIYLDQKPIGFIQYYCLADHLPEGISGHNTSLFDKATPEQLAGIDLFIAEPSCRGVGLGRQIIRHFIAKQLYRFKAVVVDPQIGNEQAIACYQKAGFLPTQHSEDANYLLMINMLTYRGSHEYS
ncbi:TPA: GNAT family N-acetyltransferase [Legionella pneumophila]